MRRSTLLVAVAFALLLAACSGRPDEPLAGEPLPEAPDTDEPMAATQSCTSDSLGYRIDYPADWHTTTGEVVEECTLFDSEPIDLSQDGMEVITEVAVAITVEQAELDEVTGEDLSTEVVASREATVAGRRALREELRTAAQGATPEGASATRWAVDLGGRTLVAVSYDHDTPDYDTKAEVLDAMVQTLSFTAT